MSDLYPVAVLTGLVSSERSRRFPQGASTTLGDLASSDALVVLDDLRSKEPISWIPEMGGWLITDHDSARSLILPRDDVTVQSEQNMVRASLGRMMLTVDRDEHRRRRKPFEPEFRPREVTRRFSPYVEGLTNELIDGFEDEGECDLAHSFARPFAIRMAARVVGLDLGEIGRIDGFLQRLCKRNGV